MSAMLLAKYPERKQRKKTEKKQQTEHSSSEENDDDSIIKKEWITIINELPITNVQYEYFIDSAYGGDNADYNVILECFKYNNCLYITL